MDDRMEEMRNVYKILILFGDIGIHGDIFHT